MIKLHADYECSHTSFIRGNRRWIVSKSGFTLVELMITMVIFVLVIAAGSRIFTGLLTQFKQQSKISETNIEGIVGLEILRQDIARAGYGLPWNLGGADYDESIDNGNTIQNETNYNDAGATDAPPRAIVSGNGDGAGNSDVIVIKAANVASNFAAGKWQPLRSGSSSAMKTWWVPDRENVCRSDDDSHFPNVRVIVISPGSTTANSRRLVVSGGSFFTGADDYINLTNFAPEALDPETRIMYGINPDTDLRMPFNRADYYIRTPSAANFPDRCTIGTGILYKATVNHNGGGLSELPLLDCVADMQVVFGLDNDNDGDFEPGVSIDGYSDDISAFTAQDIRDRVRQVRVYILAQEGQRDPNYSYPSATVSLGGDVGLGRSFNLTAIQNYQNYRWKLYTLVVGPNNLR